MGWISVTLSVKGSDIGMENPSEIYMDVNEKIQNLHKGPFPGGKRRACARMLHQICIKIMIHHPKYLQKLMFPITAGNYQTSSKMYQH